MIEQLKKIIQESNNIVFFGGAGVSTESNIPDFRSNDGIYQKKQYPYPAEVMLSHDFFWHHTEEFYDFYFHEMIYEDAKPNAAHIVLAQLEQEGKCKAIITQNIDGLHQKAGSKEVLELHGSVQRNYCTHCHTFFDLNQMLKQKNTVPKCDRCGHIIKPDVVLYQESLDQEVLSKAIDYISKADVLIVGGTSLVVYPAAGLLQYFKGHTLVLINKDQTPYDNSANIVIHDRIGEVLKRVKEETI